MKIIPAKSIPNRESLKEGSIEGVKVSISYSLSTLNMV